MKETYFQIAEERSECFGFPEWEIQAFLLLSSLVSLSRPKIVPSIYPCAHQSSSLSSLYWFHSLMGSSLRNNSSTSPNHFQEIPITDIYLSTSSHVINPPSVNMDREDVIQWGGESHLAMCPNLKSRSGNPSHVTHSVRVKVVFPKGKEYFCQQKWCSMDRHYKAL